MPWQEAKTVTLRQEFCLFANREGANVSELCRRFAISRKTGYKWLRRFAAEGKEGLEDRSRRPHATPGQTATTIETRVRQLRDAHPTWGGRKLRRRLEDLGEPTPAASTITEILRRGDRLVPDDPRHRGPWKRFEHPAPNDLWQMDFKGDVPMGAARCYPLHVLDDHSRYNLGLVACANQQGVTVQAAMTVIFQQYGMPWRILCDNGSPWGAVRAECGLTGVGVWMIQLGIELIHGRPYHPQTQGKLERANRTIAADVLAIPRYPDLAAFQQAFDDWRQVYNQQRPHEALGLATPGSRYAPSPRAFPAVLPGVEYDTGELTRKVNGNGMIDFQGRQLRISKALIGHRVAVRPTMTDGVWEVYFSHQRVRTIDQGHPRLMVEEPWVPLVNRNAAEERTV
jgi:transposase InsO family protein